ncbi:alpha/beta-hydrolase [Periconia macrospinosa]|uniref:Carboxypeptidase n=1 Tax=Periconia macrospinosa TaxID=97972 RepID=A0A2V1DJD3_9PLEO|nr:alpha/beta-hydrolase [Periconia macrospinosa]
MPRFSHLVAFLAAATSTVRVAARKPTLEERGIPKDPTGVRTITSPQGATIRFKQPGKEGICETTPGVDDYSGYISLDNNTNMFFWFFEARENPSEKPLTLWLNGGPGSDSLVGLFQEHGPCNVTEELKTQLNPYSWNEASNMLYLSQPLGVGFSYEETRTTEDGRFHWVDQNRANTTEAAAVGAWEVIQAFLDLSPQLDPDIENFTFNLWTESYGGHYGPSFYNHFYQQNEAIKNGSITGVELQMDTLGIINGLVDEEIQAPYYPEFAINNTYGIKAINESVYFAMKFAYEVGNGCRDQIRDCKATKRNTPNDYLICAGAANLCRGMVEEPYYDVSGRGAYDIRRPFNDVTPPNYFADFLNTADTQDKIGVNINYTNTGYSDEVGWGFWSTGDFIFPNFFEDLEDILGYGVRVALVYGDADYVCNWFGGEAVSLAVNYTHAESFRAAGYAPFVLNGTEYGAVRGYGNFSFTRIYEAGHLVPYYQPEASLELFRRAIEHRVLADGGKVVTGEYSTNGTAEATHTAPFVPLPTSTSSTASARAKVLNRIGGFA